MLERWSVSCWEKVIGSATFELLGMKGLVERLIPSHIVLSGLNNVVSTKTGSYEGLSQQVSEKVAI